MVKVTFLDSDGAENAVDIAEGEHLMHAALDNNIDGIIGECGGACACATCHVYLSPQVFDLLPEPSDIENEMLDFAVSPRRDTSRLGCQVKVTAAMDGMIVTLPENQV